MAENFANDVSGLLSAAIANSTDTTINLVSATGFPAVNFRVRIDNEYMLVTSLGTGLNWTVTRGTESTAAVAHANGAAVYQVVTLGGLLQYVTDRFVALAGLPITVVAGTTVTAVAGNHYVLTNAAATTVTLPASPSAGATVMVTAQNGLATNIIARNGQLLMVNSAGVGLAEDMTYDLPAVTLTLKFSNSIWRII